MRLRRRKIENKIELQMLTGMIISDKVLRDIRAVWRAELVQVPYARTVADWCFEYWDRYGKAPGVHIEDIHASKARKEDDPHHKLIGDFLESMSAEYERTGKINDDWILDQAEKRFKSRSLEAVAEDITAELASGDTEAAEKALADYKRVERPSVDGINPYLDGEAIYDAFESDATEPLFRLPGALGRMVNEHLLRDSLIGIMGREKMGKTWWLMEFGKRAARARCNTVMFQVGDMSQRQMVRRKHISLAGKSDMRRYCGRISVPTLDCRWNQDDSCDLQWRASKCGLDGAEELGDEPEDYSTCSKCARQGRLLRHFRGAVWWEEIDTGPPLTWREAVRYGKRFAKRMGSKDYRLVTHPNSTVTVAAISAQLDVWEELEGWIPDVVLIDYADILAPEPGEKDFRHQQNDTWKALRRLSQEHHCLTITATQADAASYETRTLRLKNFSEDKRKYGHINGMLGLNQTDEEKDIGIQRINWLSLREGEYDPTHTVKVLQSLQTGRPYLDSYA